ncbi:hypothetical protein [Roseibium aggregatum]|uniref:Peptidase S8/S53 domain-containing protein n=1 Tax=Roseibium aggregatum TaxID=187304 RepID=A0A926NV15_9HYPH|nr:hypothetical protein [Roseibium aggregatum]MBD1544921.1 hypothetical protein [Roseibium aggregatum]
MIRIGLIDGALPADFPGLIAQARLFDPDGSPAAEHHAGAMAATIRAQAGEVHFVNAVVFPGRLSTSAQTVCDALEWLAEDPPEIVLCSFGMARSSVELTARTKALLQAGSLVVASAPARGDPVFPAAIGGVLSVQGDARCQPGDLSRLDLPQATFGACPIATDHPDIRGASAAAAHMAGLLAKNWQGSAADTQDALKTAFRYRGRERRSA